MTAEDVAAGSNPATTTTFRRSPARGCTQLSQQHPRTPLATPHDGAARAHLYMGTLRYRSAVTPDTT